MPEPGVWRNPSARKCASVFDVLCKIEQHGVPLPDSRAARDFGAATAQVILDFGQRVFMDDKLWAQLPKRLSAVWTKDQLRAFLGRELDESR